MNHNPTPGHSGKVCSNPQNVVQPEEMAKRLTTDNPLWFYSGSITAFCPACGILLQPEPEPLPVPEGYDIVRSNPGAGRWYVEAHKGLGIGSNISFWADTQAEAESAWRRAFAKESK